MNGANAVHEGRERGAPPDTEAEASSLLDECLAKAMQGQAAAWPVPVTNESVDWIDKRIRFHGVAYILANRPEAIAGWPNTVKNAIAEEARAQAFWEHSHQREIADLLKALDRAGVPALLMKGTALAYSVFPDPAMRRRGDSDMLIAPEHRGRANEVLRESGFVIADSSPLQQDWIKASGDGFTHIVDLHWAASSVPALRCAFTPEQAFAHAVPLDALRPGARAMDPIRLFLHDCLNQALHAYGGYPTEDAFAVEPERLIWSYGTKLQADRLTPQQWCDLVDLAAQWGLSRLCLQALQRARMRFDLTMPTDAEGRLEAAGTAGKIDRFLLEMDGWQRLVANWSASRGVQSKVALLRGNVLPSAHHMRSAYPGMKDRPLWMLHARRMLAVPARLFGRSKH